MYKKNNQLIINLFSSIIVFCINLIINFFLSPYIVKNIGIEANGFISLANNFVSYATLATIALNSMAGRFITIRFHKNDLYGANKYYTSVTIGNFIISLFMIIPSILCLIYLQKIIEIPSNMIIDVKLLFSTIFINFIINTAFSSWGTATFITNKLYLQSIRNMQAQILRVVIIIMLFYFFKPSIYYIGIATLISSVFAIFYSLHYKKILLPEMKIKIKQFNFHLILELIVSGIWNTIIQAGQLLLSGMDLLITNLFIGPIEMGMLSLAKIIPNVITQLSGTITSVFTPTLTINYAKDDLHSLREELKRGMKITGVILTIPLSILIVFGREFYNLWVPSQDAKVLQILSVLTCFGLVFTSGVQALYNIFTVVNKLKIYSILILLSGLISTVIVFILLRNTNLGIYAVAAVSSFINLVRNMLFTIPFAAKYIGLKWNTFIPEVMASVLSVIVLVIIGTIIRYFFVVNTWLSLFIVSIMLSILGIIVNTIIVLNNEEKRYFTNILINRIKR